MNVKHQVAQDFKIITEQDLKTFLGYVKTDDITDEMMTSALVCATIRVDTLSAGIITSTSFDTITPEAQTKVKLAACFLAQYYLTGGYTWLRGSTSISAGQINISQSMPDEPDYLLPQILPLLQINQENLYKPTVSFKKEFGVANYDDSFTDTPGYTMLTWEDALKTFLKPNNVWSRDASVIIKLVKNLKTSEPAIDLSVNVSSVNKYYQDNTTTQIDSKNVISVVGMKDKNYLFTPTTLQQILLGKASLSDLVNKADKDLQNVDLNVAVLPQKDNALTVIDKKFFVKKDGGSLPFMPDDLSIELDTQTNLISAVGLKKKDGVIIKSYDVAELLDKAVRKDSLKDIVLDTSENALKIKDEKLFADKEVGKDYHADNETTSLDTDTNTFKAIGLITQDVVHKTVSGHDVFLRGNIAVENQRSIAQLFIKDTANVKKDHLDEVIWNDYSTSYLELTENKLSIDYLSVVDVVFTTKNKIKPAPITSKIYVIIDDFYKTYAFNEKINLLQIDKKEEKFYVVADNLISSDKDNILKEGTDRKLLVEIPTPKAPAYKLISLPTNWTYKYDNKEWVCNNINLKLGYSYKFAVKLENDVWVFSKEVFFLNTRQFVSEIIEGIWDEATMSNVKFIWIRYYFGNPSIFYLTLQTKKQILNSDYLRIYLYEMKANFDLPPTPSKPILSQQIIYDSNKKFFC